MRLCLQKPRSNPRTRDQSSNIIPGRCTGLRQSKYALIEQAVRSVAEWASECVAGRISCGNFLMHWSSRRGNSTEVCILIGPSKNLTHKMFFDYGHMNLCLYNIFVCENECGRFKCSLL